MSHRPDETASLEVRAYPRAARNQVGPMDGGRLQVRVVRPANDGEANAAVRRLVADALGVAPSRLRLVSGDRARLKRFVIRDMTAAELAGRLSRIDGGRD